MDAPVKSLAATVNEAVTALSGISNVAARLKRAAVNVAGRVDQVNSLADDLESADAILALAVNGAAVQPTTNGPPSGPLPGNEAPQQSSSTPQPDAQPSPASTTEITAIGPIQR
jgi:hypothetical protein